MTGDKNPIPEGVTRLSQAVGTHVVGPLVGASLAAPEVRGEVVRSAVVLGSAIALGVALGLWLGRRGAR
jgi:hypothetical protein